MDIQFEHSIKYPVATFVGGYAGALVGDHVGKYIVYSLGDNTKRLIEYLSFWGGGVWALKSYFHHHGTYQKSLQAKAVEQVAKHALTTLIGAIFGTLDAFYNKKKERVFTLFNSISFYGVTYTILLFKVIYKNGYIGQAI